MDFLIVTGLSGAGKSRALCALEDIGYFCVDNLPPLLIPKFADLALQSQGQIDRVAVMTDLRGGSLFDGLFDALQILTERGIAYRILYLEASAAELMNRYRQTRRRHPLAGHGASLESLIAKERDRLLPVRERADFCIDTTFFTNAQLKERIVSLFSAPNERTMHVTCMSFGFKYGLLSEADLVFDLRCLPNPFWEPSLRPMSGLDEPVRDYVLEKPQTEGLVVHLQNLLQHLLPLYNDEGKSQLTIAFGCTGGRHRSVALATLFGSWIEQQGYRTFVQHRDMDKYDE